MADNERNARLVLRAEDRATRTFKQVGDSIKDVTRRLEEQSKAAAAGGGSLDDLTSTLREIQRAGEDLEKGRAALRAFDRTSEAAEKAAERVSRTTKAYDAYKAKVDAAGSTTEAQGRRLDNLAASVEKAQSAFDRQNSRVDAARDKLAALGLSAENTGRQVQDIVAVFDNLLPIYGQATRAVDGFAGAQEKAAAASKLRAAQEAEGAARTAEIAAQAERDAIASERRRRTEIEASLQLALQRDAAIAKSQADAMAAAQRESGFRQVADDALVASGNLNRFAQTTDGVQVGLTRLGEAVRQIVAPTLASVQSLDGAIAAIDQAADVAASKQKQRVSQYQDALKGLTQAQAALVRQADNIDALNKQTVVLDRLEAELGQAATKVDTLAAALRKVPDNAEDVARELAQARAELERVGQRTLDARKRFVELQDGLRRAGVDTENLTAELNRLEGAAKRSAVVADTLTTRVGGNGKGFLGLKSYELTNLGYQINDVFTSLASGISPVQTLAQQGPQIAQLFPKILVGALRLLPVLLPIGAAFGVLAANIAAANREADAIKGFDQIFALSGNAADLSAQQFGRAQVALERAGVSASDAKKALTEFINAGLNPAGLNTFLNTVRQIATATGEDVPAAAEKYAAALSGGYEQVVALNDVTNTLNDTQLEEIQTLFDAGKAQEARTRVAEIYRAKAQEVADKSKSEWKTATDELGQAFRNLNDALYLTQGGSAVARLAVNQLAEDLRALKGVADFAAAAVRNAVALRNDLNTSEERNFRTGQGAIRPASFERDGGGSALTSGRGFLSALRRTTSPTSGGGSRTGGGQAFLRQQQTELKQAKELSQAERLLVAERDAANKAANAGANDAEIRQAKINARKIEQGKIDKENAAEARKAGAAARKAGNEVERAAREAETRQNRINNLTRELENTYASISTNRQDDPFEAIQKKAETAVRNIQAKFADLAKLGVTTVGGKTKADFLAGVEAARVLETQQARQKKNEEDVNRLLELRKTVLAEIEDRVGDGVISPLQGLDESAAALGRLNPQIRDAAQRALEFAQSLRTAEPDPKLEAFIARLQSVVREAASNRTLISFDQGALKEAQANLDALVARRDDIVKLQEALVNAGLKTPGDARKAITEAFNASRPAILAAADAVQQIVQRLLAIPGITPEVRAALEAVLAGLPVVRAETQQLDADLVTLRQSAENALSSAIGGFLNTLGTTIADVIDGTSSLSDALGGIAGAALQFAADFTKAIAQAIIQLVALKIAKAALNAVGVPVFHGGGVVGSGGGRRRDISPLAFAGAVRYHTGGLVGLRPNEQAAILEKGERVLTEAEDKRYQALKAGAGAGGAAPQVNLKNINLFNAGEAVSEGANTLEGEQAILNVVDRNRRRLGLPD